MSKNPWLSRTASLPVACSRVSAAGAPPGHRARPEPRNLSPFRTPPVLLSRTVISGPFLPFLWGCYFIRQILPCPGCAREEAQPELRPTARTPALLHGALHGPAATRCPHTRPVAPKRSRRVPRAAQAVGAAAKGTPLLVLSPSPHTRPPTASPPSAPPSADAAGRQKIKIKK